MPDNVAARAHNLLDCEILSREGVLDRLRKEGDFRVSRLDSPAERTKVAMGKKSVKSVCAGARERGRDRRPANW